MPELPISKWLTIGCAVVALVAACLAIYAAQIEIRDTLDTTAEDERRIGWWNTLAASLNAISGAMILLALAVENFVEK